MDTKTAAGGSGKGGKKSKKANNGAWPKGVDEAARIRISEILQRFRSSNEEVYKFGSNLNNFERAAVHMLCRKMGMRSKSHGHGNARQVSVFNKGKKIDSQRGNETLTCLKFSKGAKTILNDLFSRYPPGDEETTSYMSEKHNKKAGKLFGLNDDIFRKPAMDKSDIAKKVELLASRVEKSQDLRQTLKRRSKLPIASFKDIITSSIESYQVVLISGETGCGKTTQVPQYILDHMWAKGETCKVVCTQPRRISATSVSERISTERGENLGDTVGYKIRMESSGGRHSSIVFCTNGVLLRILVNTSKLNKKALQRGKDAMSDITHIIVDEIHERDRFSDFMLAIIRDMLPLYPHLRLILMSATMDEERFSKYFGGCPIIRVPGFTYPVKTFYLEDVLGFVKSVENNHLDNTTASLNSKDSVLTEEYRVALDEAINLAATDDEIDPLLDIISSEAIPAVINYQHSLIGVTPLMVFAGKGSINGLCTLLSLGADCHLKTKNGTTALDWAQQQNQTEAAEIIKKHIEKSFSNSEEQQLLLDKYLSTVHAELIDEVLIEQLIRKICMNSKDGAILVFLPGWDDINRTRERLHKSAFFKDASKFSIIPLHSMVPSVEQKKAFKRPPPDCRKIILSTNIAETAVTIDDVVFVIDSGRVKEKSYDPYNNVSTLQSSWISKASAKQREGRAGRCQPGICYHLYSKLRSVSLPEFQVPEIKRMPIEELCLQIKLLDPDCNVEEFLQKTLDPPVYETIRNAIIVLQDIGALTIEEKLTELGQRIGSLPVHPLTSKMLLIAILLNCLDPALTLACASEYKDPFTLPMLPTERKKADAAKAELATLYGGRSDQLAVVAAFECWEGAKQKGEESKFCSLYYVSSGTMKMISRMRKQLQSELLRNGFIIQGYMSEYNLNAQDPGILHAVLVAGLYPMVGRMLPPLRGGGGRKNVVETAGGDKVRLHPCSTNFKLSVKNREQPIILYDEITRGDSGLHIRRCSIIGPLLLLLLATEIVVVPANDNNDVGDDNGSDYESGCEDDSEEEKKKSDLSNGENVMSSPDNRVKVVVDRWLPFFSTALDVAQIYCLRERLSAAILYRVTYPSKELPEALCASMYAFACILSFDWMNGISLPCEPIDSLTTMVRSAEISESPSGKKNAEANKNYLKSLMCHDSLQNQNMPTSLGASSSQSSALQDLLSGPGSAMHRGSRRQRGNGS
ncbi:PREDICTED: DExH-box ATP-dependent RNA helicase DExH6-like [Ipomoea nil]|uniref:DExH-box ATP-dependent RNA helicase DExH6-like n=1 Tax=Ipomoea nil TaxID=35883 RepID=UPI0009015FAE|nr:PREDICTED: DExH-box ATP-dependent RNA helicase DExH6-like [Ipomoea nil]